MDEKRQNGSILYFEESGQGRPLIFLHGLGGDRNQPGRLLTHLAGIRLITPDQRAHGKSGMLQDGIFTFDAMADDVIALADSLGLERFALGGISMGAGVAANAACRYTDRIARLFLVRPAWGDGPMDAESMEWYRTLSGCLKEQDMEGFKRSPQFLELCNKAPEAVDSFLKAFTEEASLRYPEKFSCIPMQRPFRNMEDLRMIRAETAVLANQYDRIHKYTCGQMYMQYLEKGIFHEIVSKTVSEEGHRKDLNVYLSYYMNRG